MRNVFPYAADREVIEKFLMGEEHEHPEAFLGSTGTVLVTSGCEVILSYNSDGALLANKCSNHKYWQGLRTIEHARTLLGLETEWLHNDTKTKLYLNGEEFVEPMMMCTALGMRAYRESRR